MFLGYHCSHEQLPPGAMLEAVVTADRIGFDGAFSADHLAPWTTAQGESGNTLAWLGAALARTRFEIGAVATPGYRYHPVVTAHALATFAEMFPGRVFNALGSGELLNEHSVALPWPDKAERMARLQESVGVIRRLLDGEEVSHDGRIRVDRARLWSLPSTKPPLFALASGADTAAWAAQWADGLLTVGIDPEVLGATLRAYRNAGGRGETAVQVHFVLAETDDAAMALVRDQWRHGVVEPPRTWEIATPQEFDALAATPDDDLLRSEVLVATDLDELIGRINDLVAVGVDRVYLHEISKDQAGFLRDLAPPLLAGLRADEETR